MHNNFNPISNLAKKNFVDQSINSALPCAGMLISSSLAPLVSIKGDLMCGQNFGGQRRISVRIPLLKGQKFMIVLKHPAVVNNIHIQTFTYLKIVRRF